MENINENPIAEETVVESPVVEEAPVVEAPVVEEVHVEPVVEEAPIQLPVEEAPEVPALAAVANGVMGSTTVPRPERLVANPHVEDSVEKVAIHSTKNVAWEGVGKVSRGYNIVTKEAAEQWLTRSHIRIALPEEVKKAFG
jgi:hypothetical protein